MSGQRSFPHEKGEGVTARRDAVRLRRICDGGEDIVLRKATALRSGSSLESHAMLRSVHAQSKVDGPNDILPELGQ